MGWQDKIIFTKNKRDLLWFCFPISKAFAEEEDIMLSQGKNVEIDNKVNKDIVTKFSNSLGQKFEARDYRMNAIYHSLKHNRTLLLSPTANY